MFIIATLFYTLIVSVIAKDAITERMKMKDTLRGGTTMRGLKTEDIAIRHSCPKCGSTVYIGKDYYGWYEGCPRCDCKRDLPRILAGEVQERINKG